MSYCERVTSEQYEQQKHDVAHDALLHLLDNILDDRHMTPVAKRRRLLQVSFKNELAASNMVVKYAGHSHYRVKSFRLRWSPTAQSTGMLFSS